MPEWTSTVSFAGVEQAIAAGAARATARVGDHVLDEALAVIPEDPDRRLARSGTVTTEQTATGSTTAVAFDTPYAVRQHEDLTLHHEGGETAKYLERPHTAAASDGTALAIVAEELGKAIP